MSSSPPASSASCHDSSTHGTSIPPVTEDASKRRSKPAMPSDGDVEIVTFGCRLNSYESELMATQAKAAGVTQTTIVNTCAVTAEAVRQAKQTVRKINREHPNRRIVVTGCAAQIYTDTFQSMEEVSHVVENQAKTHASVWNSLALHDTLPAIVVDDLHEIKETSRHLVGGFANRARAFVEVQNGCDHACTFCIIPKGRGASRSTPAGSVVRQIQRLVDEGHIEIVLTGVDLTSWGADLPGHPTLGNLIQSILRHVPDLMRLRISSLDSAELDSAFFEAISDPRVMPHIHLSLQSGNDLILKRMRRRHLREHAIATCEDLRRARPDIALGADLIAGFPTETEAHFQDTLALFEDCPLDFAHIFAFSPRPGTPAARMPQVPRPIRTERAKALRMATKNAFNRYAERAKDNVINVLVENSMGGYNDHFARVQFTSHMDAQLPSKEPPQDQDPLSKMGTRDHLHRHVLQARVLGVSTDRPTTLRATPL